MSRNAKGGGVWSTATSSGRFAKATKFRGRCPILPPVMPSKIVCVGLNYRDHAAEQQKPLPPEPMLFIKPSTSVIGPGEPIRSPLWAGAWIMRPSSAS